MLHTPRVTGRARCHHSVTCRCLYAPHLATVKWCSHTIKARSHVTTADCIRRLRDDSANLFYDSEFRQMALEISINAREDRVFVVNSCGTTCVALHARGNHTYRFDSRGRYQNIRPMKCVVRGTRRPSLFSSGSARCATRAVQYKGTSTRARFTNARRSKHQQAPMGYHVVKVVVACAQKARQSQFQLFRVAAHTNIETSLAEPESEVRLHPSWTFSHATCDPSGSNHDSFTNAR